MSKLICYLRKQYNPFGVIAGAVLSSITRKEKRVEHYRNLNGNSGVLAYELGADFIMVEFKDGSLYLYNYAKTGQQNVERMKAQAEAGSGLNSFISKTVRKAYAAKLR